MQMKPPVTVVRRNSRVFVADPEPEPPTPPVIAATPTVSARNMTPRRSQGSWTRKDPYTRGDGTAVVSTTVYLPKELHEELRTYAFTNDVKHSQVVEEALRAFLSDQD